MKFLEAKKKGFKTRQQETMSLEDFLTKAKTDPTLYASPAERLLTAIGEPKLVDTSKDPRLSRIFSNRVIKVYEAFQDFYGMEDTIEQIVNFFRYAAQGLEESRQILYLLGPVGSAKSSLAERLKELMEKEPIYVLAIEKDGELLVSPIHESPLGLFSPSDAKELGIPARALREIPSPWAIKRLEEEEGDLSKFRVVKMFPSQHFQVAITKTEPGDENTQDISVLVGKLDIRKLEFFAQNDPDAYSFSGGLCLGNRGLLEFVEMFKAPLKVLNPLLTATQEHNYKGTEPIAAIPFDGIVLAHSNESEWQQFKNNKQNEALLDRVYVVEVPYCLRYNEEVNIYKKILEKSNLGDAHCAPETLKLLAQFAVMSRLSVPTSGHKDLSLKLKVYDGDNIREQSVDAKSFAEYRALAEPDEGFNGISTRFAYKVLAKTYNYDPTEVAADPVHLLTVLQKTVDKEFVTSDLRGRYEKTLEELAKDYEKVVGRHIKTAVLDSYEDYGQALFDRYVLYADHWTQNNDYRDPDTGQVYNLKALDKFLAEIELGMQIHNPKDFRQEVVTFALRYQRDKGRSPSWKAYGKMKEVIEEKMFSQTEDLLPVISFSGQVQEEHKEKHARFLENMKKLGYTEKQVRRVVEWHAQMSKS